MHMYTTPYGPSAGCCMVLEIFIISLTIPSGFIEKQRATADMKVSVVALCKHDGIVKMIRLWILFMVLTSSVNLETGVTTQRLF